MQAPTHAGGIVFKPTPGGPHYLVVRSTSAAGEWIFPKGHIDPRGDRMETPEETAVREVEEETGVLAEIVAPLRQLQFHKGEEAVCAEMFLMRFVGQGRQAEPRECQWVSFDGALMMLGHADARSLLKQARSLQGDDMQDNGESSRQVLLKQLDLLNDQMKDTAAEGNAFQAKFLFGGLIAVVALLNADLVLLDEPVFSACGNSLWLAIVLLLGVLVLSRVFFKVVTQKYLDYVKSHRRLKYKFEMTLHSLLLSDGNIGREYSRRLEESVKAEPRNQPLEYPKDGSLNKTLDYMLDHHRKRYREIEEWNKSPLYKAAMLLVILTMVVRLLPILDKTCIAT